MSQIRVERRFEHPVAAVWHALTSPNLVARWWASGDVRAVVGHRFTLDMGKWGDQPCEVTEVVPEKRLVYRFGTTTINTLITWELTADGNGTKLLLLHEGFDVDSPMGRAALEGMGSGWPRVVERIDTVLREAA